MSKHIRQFEFAWGRLAFLSIAIIFSSLIGWFGQPLISNNTDAINTIVTIFSILAGFLIAVITFIAEPALARAKNWEELQKLKPLVEKKLARQSILFVLYLATLGLALLMFLVPDDYHNILVWFERAFLALAIFIFILSFTLPGSLMKIQMERYESILESSAPQNLQRDSKDQQV